MRETSIGNIAVDPAPLVKGKRGRTEQLYNTKGRVYNDHAEHCRTRKHNDVDKVYSHHPLVFYTPHSESLVLSDTCQLQAAVSMRTGIGRVWQMLSHRATANGLQVDGRVSAKIRREGLMLLCTCCGLPMSVCECDPGWYTMDEQRRMKPDYPYRYDPGYDWDEEYWGDDDNLPHDLDDPLTCLWHDDWIEEEDNERKTAVMLFEERS